MRSKREATVNRVLVNRGFVPRGKANGQENTEISRLTEFVSEEFNSSNAKHAGGASMKGAAPSG